MLNLWIPLLLLAIAVFAIVTTKCKELLKPALVLGLFLMVFDFLFESLGAVLGLWHINPANSILMLGVVPVEVLLIAFFAGATYYYILAPKTDFKRMVFTALMIATAGMVLEKELIALNHMTYSPDSATFISWNPIYAFIAYFAVFTLLYFIKGIVHKTFAGNAGLKCRCFEGD